MPTLEKNKKIIINRVVRNILSNQILYYSEIKGISRLMARELVANHVGITRNQLAYWEHNRTQPSLEQALVIAQFLDKEIKQLFTIIEA